MTFDLIILLVIILERRKAEQKERVETPKVDECEDMESDSHEVDYENTTGAKHDSQHEDTVSEEPDEDYVNTERRNCQDQYEENHSEYPAKQHIKRPMQGNRIFLNLLYMVL